MPVWTAPAPRHLVLLPRDIFMPAPVLADLRLLFASLAADRSVLVPAHALIVEAPEKQTQVARGRNATLRCNFKTNSAADRGDLVVWKKINSKVDAVSRYFDGLVQYGEGYDHRIQFIGDVDSGDISITIGAVTMEDNGTYVCSVRLRDDPPRTSALQDLFVLVAPSKPECKILGTPEYGQTINLTCASHEGSPTPRYTWKSFNMQNEPRLLPYTEGQQITLKNISADTSGFYICTATNIVGTEFCNMTVSAVPPSMNIALYAGIIGGQSKDTDYEMTVQEDRNEPSRQMPTRHESIGEDVENA